MLGLFRQGGARSSQERDNPPEQLAQTFDCAMIFWKATKEADLEG